MMTMSQFDPWNVPGMHLEEQHMCDLNYRYVQLLHCESTVL